MPEDRARLQAWAEAGDGRLLARAGEIADRAVFNPKWDQWVMDRLPRVLGLPWRVADQEMEILNGGYFQFFWNGGGDYAAALVDDFGAMGADRYVAVHKAALDRWTAVGTQIKASPTYQDGLAIEDFQADTVAYMAVHDTVGAACDLASAWLAERVDELADAIDARSPNK